MKILRATFHELLCKLNLHFLKREPAVFTPILTSQNARAPL